MGGIIRRDDGPGAALCANISHINNVNRRDRMRGREKEADQGRDWSHNRETALVGRLDGPFVPTGRVRIGPCVDPTVCVCLGTMFLRYNPAKERQKIC